MERHVFSEALEGLRQTVRRMGTLVGDRLSLAVEAVFERRPELAQPVVEGDAEVNGLQGDLDDRCLTLLARQQPVARDLRLITSVMKVASDLERVGDQAVNIAGNALVLAPLRSLLPMPELTRLAEGASRMLKASVEAYLDADVEVGRRVLAEDDEIDALRNRIFRLVIDDMIGDPHDIEPGLGIILVSRNLERIADHATNIAEDVIFLVEGRDVRHLHEPS